MQTGELLRTLRQIVREETSLARQPLRTEMNARFDHAETLFDGLAARLDRIHSIAASITGGVSP
jgi:hypothetical protein